MIEFPPELFCRLTDYLTAGIVALIGDGTFGAGHGVPDRGIKPSVEREDDFGLAGAMRHYDYEIMVQHSHQLTEAMGKTAHDLTIRCGGWKLAKDLLHRAVMEMANVCAQCGVPTVPVRQYATPRVVTPGLHLYVEYYNSGPEPNRALVSPEFAELTRLVYGLGFENLDIYAPPDVLGTLSISGAFVPGQVVDANQYAGVVQPQLNLTDYTGSAGEVVVYGSARTGDHYRELRHGRVWTATLSDLGIGATETGELRLDLTPANAGDLLIAVTAIELPRGGTGHATVRGIRPTR